MTLVGYGGPGEENVDAGDDNGDGPYKGNQRDKMIGHMAQQLRLEIEERCVDISVLLRVILHVLLLG